MKAQYRNATDKPITVGFKSVPLGKAVTVPANGVISVQAYPGYNASCTQNRRPAFSLPKSAGLTRAEHEELFRRLTAECDGAKLTRESNGGSSAATTAQVSEAITNLRAQMAKAETTGNR